jgi:chemotaxis regulatin CheY-phosphate phosphatase CheZ
MSVSRRSDALNFVKKSDMIQEILTEMEMEVKYAIYTEQKNLVAVKNLKELLNQIDHEVEVVPYKDKEKLSRLLVSLKGQTLNDVENRVIERIIKSNNEKEKQLI